MARAISYTVAHHCKCGAALFIDGRSHRYKWQSLVHSFTQLHTHCITQKSDDVIEEPGGDVFTHAERAHQHSQHELQIGFQREDQW